MCIQVLISKYFPGAGGGDMVATPLEKLIHTKWMEAKVTFHGAIPSNLSG